MTVRKCPKVGEVILGDTYGYTLPAIATKLQQHLAKLDQCLDAEISARAKTDDGEDSPSQHTILQFIRRIDDLADVATVMGERTANLSHNLMEYHLSLIRELEGDVSPEAMTILLRRFSVRQGLRASRLTEHAGLHKVLLPILPW